MSFQVYHLFMEIIVNASIRAIHFTNGSFYCPSLEKFYFGDNWKSDEQLKRPLNFAFASSKIWLVFFDTRGRTRKKTVLQNVYQSKYLELHKTHKTNWRWGRVLMCVYLIKNISLEKFPIDRNSWMMVFGIFVWHMSAASAVAATCCAHIHRALKTIQRNR